VLWTVYGPSGLMGRMESNLILVLGATGKTGRRVAERLHHLGCAVRIGSRHADPPFDWDDRSTWPAALDGVASAYVSYYPDLTFPGAVDAVGEFARTAAAAGVGHLVLLSGRGEEAARRAEAAVGDAGVDWTVIRASWFAQNFSEHFLLQPVLDGVIALPAGDVAEPFVDVEDIADIAAAALTEDGHADQMYEVTGPRLLTFADAATELGRAIGRPVRYIAITPEEYAAAAVDQGVPAEEAGPLAELFSRVLDGRNARLEDGVRRALGRPARDFADYAAAAAATGVWDTYGRDAR
jgi:uncharacterized protein YbjT (DUF2867 family)